MESRNNVGLAVAVLVGLSIVFRCRAQNSPKDYLDAHNVARSEVGVCPMEWDDALAGYALGYAGERSGECALVHSGGPHGENIYVGYGEGYSSGTDAVRWWYNEKPYYDYVANACVGGTDCLHYTQMVWRDSVRLGCARVECSTGAFFVTRNYDPPGNVWGQRPY